MLKELITRSRSFRRFHQESFVDKKTLKELVDLARLAPTGANRQPLKYILSCDPEKNALIFPQLGWAAYLKDWPGPKEGEKPSAYIIIMGDTQLSREFGCDYGIAAQTIMLGAAERGLGGCMIATVKRAELKAALQIPYRYEVLLVLALGVPTEVVRIVDVGPEGDIKYWRDAEGVHHVPKRSLDELILDL